MHFVSSKKLAARLALTAATVTAGVASAPSEAHAQGKQGTAFVNFGMGPQFYLNGGATEFMIQFQGGIEINRDLYVTFVPNFGFGGGGTTIILPLGIQYDIPIRSVPNLYVYPRISAGLGLVTGGGATHAAFNLTPEFGIKYVIDGKFNVGFEPFSLPLLIAGSPFPQTLYRLTFLGGMNF